MAIDERSRHVLFQKLENVLGGDEASSLMEYLPPVGWADVATKQDIHDLRIATKQDIQDLQVATKQDIENVRVGTKQDIQDLRVATKQDFENLRVGMNHLGELMEKDFRAVVTKDQFRRSLMAAVFSLMGFFVALSAVLVAAIRM